MLTTLLYLFNLKILVPTWYIFSILSDVSVLLLSKLRSIHLTYRPKYVTESSRQKLSQRWRIEWGRKGAGTSNNFGIDKTVSCPIWCHLGCGISKTVGPKKQDFWPRINIIKRFLLKNPWMNYNLSKSANIILSKSIFDVKNKLNFKKI